jgi:hypothetical protein
MVCSKVHINIFILTTGLNYLASDEWANIFLEPYIQITHTCACIRNAYEIYSSVGKHVQLGDTGVYGRIILKFDFKRNNVCVDVD